MLALLQRACADKTIGVVIVTCGLKPVWEKVMANLNLSNTVPIIGNGLLSDGYVVTPKAKADIVARLKYHHKLHVCAIGDSEVDLPMRKKAHQALVVVGPEGSRSKSFDAKLQNAIDNEGLRARQVLLPPIRSRGSTTRSCRRLSWTRRSSTRSSHRTVRSRSSTPLRTTNRRRNS